ncbi:hypothetical protein DJ66_0253 [Candidatus Liberibacter solanacearum]|uniref:Uncharacterized protein n=1 Tax=Candidatus Liberibacter solanacearum TaxID=556287 RepID=A0A0F4VMP5_9HYPH|nr:hypothetical protein DJ66_0253 [Candidatus Liberibacter solanacearum]
MHAGGKQLKGLVVRREAEAKLLLEGLKPVETFRYRCC